MYTDFNLKAGFVCMHVHRHTCPEHMNPAEYFADLISVDYSSSETEAATKEKIAGLVDAFAQKGVKLDHSFLYSANKAEEEMKVEIQPPQSVAIQRGSWWRQFWLLLRRAWMQVWLSSAVKRKGSNSSCIRKQFLSTESN
jgi:hypothetical protein